MAQQAAVKTCWAGEGAGDSHQHLREGDPGCNNASTAEAPGQRQPGPVQGSLASAQDVLLGRKNQAVKSQCP